MFRNSFSGHLKHRERRDRLAIVANVLEVARRGCLKGHIMYRASLSFAQLIDYLGFLLEIGLLKENNEGKRPVYRTTKKGVKFLRIYYKIMDLLRGEEKNSLELTQKCLE